MTRVLNLLSKTSPVDILMPTYNSERHLEESLRGVERCVPVNRIVAVDHHSTDSTIDVLRRHGAHVISEDVSLGYARQLLIENAETEIFMMLDSDVVLEPNGWYAEAVKLMDKKLAGRRIASVVLQPAGLVVEPLKKFLDFWWKVLPTFKNQFFATTSTLFNKDALRGIEIPKQLDGTEDIYMWLYLRKMNFSSWLMEVPGTHYHSASITKGRWVGSSLRMLQSIVGTKLVLPIITRNILLYPISASVAAAACGDSQVLLYNIRRWREYVLGYLRGQYDVGMKRLW